MANKETIQEIVLVIIGNLVLALGVTVFILPNDVLTGGLTGIAVALEPVIHVEPTLVINVMTVALFFVGWLFLGKRFALKTLVSTICYPLFLSLLAWVVDTQFPEMCIRDRCYLGQTMEETRTHLQESSKAKQSTTIQLCLLYTSRCV